MLRKCDTGLTQHGDVTSLFFCLIPLGRCVWSALSSLLSKQLSNSAMQKHPGNACFKGMRYAYSRVHVVNGTWRMAVGLIAIPYSRLTAGKQETNGSTIPTGKPNGYCLDSPLHSKMSMLISMSQDMNSKGKVGHPWESARDIYQDIPPLYGLCEYFGKNC